MLLLLSGVNSFQNTGFINLLPLANILIKLIKGINLIIKKTKTNLLTCYYIELKDLLFFLLFSNIQVKITPNTTTALIIIP